jgi:hypothetical protein
VFTYNSLEQGGAQLCPCGIATKWGLHFGAGNLRECHRSPTGCGPGVRRPKQLCGGLRTALRWRPHSPQLPRSTSPWPPGRTSTCPPASSPPDQRRNGCAPHPAHIHQIGAGEPLRDVVTLVPRVLLFVTLAEPTPSGSTGMSRLCQGCSHPPRHLPGRAALSCTALLRQDGDEGLPPPFELSAPHGARGSRLRGGRAPAEFLQLPVGPHSPEQPERPGHQEPGVSTTAHLTNLFPRES